MSQESQVAQEPEATIATEAQELAAENMLSTFMGIVLDELKAARDAWPKLAQYEQDEVINRLENQGKELIKSAVDTIANCGFTRLPAVIDQVVIKDGIKATITIGRHEAARHDLFDSAGGVCTVVLADVDQFVDAPHGHKADEKDLVDSANDSDEPVADAA